MYYSRDENDWRDAIRSLGDWDNCGDAYVLMKLSFEEYGGDGNLLPNGYQVTQEKLLLPIPQREIEIAELEQNPGY